MMADTLSKGTVITCPRKGHTIAVLNRSITTGDVILPVYFDFTEGQEAVVGEGMRCKAPLPNATCKSYYGRNCLRTGLFCIHTAGGWFPQDPILETP